MTGFAIRLLYIEWLTNDVRIATFFTFGRQQLKTAISNKNRLHVVNRLIKRVIFYPQKNVFVLIFVFIKRALERPSGMLTMRVHGGGEFAVCVFVAFDAFQRSRRVYMNAIRISREKKMKFPALSARVRTGELYARRERLHRTRNRNVKERATSVCKTVYECFPLSPLVLTCSGVVCSNTKAVSA